jgi:hypothetical protein
VLEAWSEKVEAKQARLFGPDSVIFRGPTVFGWWDEGHFDDDFDIRDPETLIIQGVNASAAEYGEWAATWIQWQLSRELSLLEWASGGRRWVFEDTGWVLHQEGRVPRQRKRRKDNPTRRTVLRKVGHTS